MSFVSQIDCLKVLSSNHSADYQMRPSGILNYYCWGFLLEPFDDAIRWCTECIRRSAKSALKPPNCTAQTCFSNTTISFYSECRIRQIGCIEKVIQIPLIWKIMGHVTHYMLTDMTILSWPLYELNPKLSR